METLRTDEEGTLSGESAIGGAAERRHDEKRNKTFHHLNLRGSIICRTTADIASNCLIRPATSDWLGAASGRDPVSPRLVDQPWVYAARPLSGPFFIH